MDIGKILDSSGLVFDKGLSYMEGQKSYSDGVIILHDFEWKCLIPHGRPAFKYGKALFKSVLDDCPNNKQAVAILTEKDQPPKKVTTANYYIVVFPIRRYLSHSSSDPVATFLAGQLSIDIIPDDGSSFIELSSNDPKVIDTYIDLHLDKLSLARWLDSSQDNVRLINAIIDKNSNYLSEELLIKLVRSEVTTTDVFALQYRKNQLKEFELLLNNEDYFKRCKLGFLGAEAVWQDFFERNHWIFGYSLGYVFISGLDGKKLELPVQGFDVTKRGKRVDALMKTKGMISNLCFVEIKIHNTPLLKTKAYRPECWPPSEELAGAVTQVHGTVASAMRNLANKITSKDDDDNPTGEEIFNYQPKSYLIIGSLKEFLVNNGVNESKLRSFELFRKNIASPEIITFDELYERAKFIVYHDEKVN